MTDAQTFVLVHGAFHGGWCWRRVADRLRAAGHQVFTPTLTGLGERAHLLSRDIDLETAARDVINVIECEELTDVVLVGHSMGGLPVTITADRIPDRIRHLVYLDAVLLENGERLLAGITPELAAQGLEVAAERFAVTVPPPELFGVTDPEDVAWLRRRLTPQPLGVLEAALELKGPVGNGLPCTYILCTAPLFGAMTLSHARAGQQPGWNVIELAAGHDAMITAPEEVTRILLQME